MVFSSSLESGKLKVKPLLPAPFYLYYYISQLVNVDHQSSSAKSQTLKSIKWQNHC